MENNTALKMFESFDKDVQTAIMNETQNQTLPECLEYVMENYEVMPTNGEWQAKEGQIYSMETGKTLALIPYYDNENEEQKANAKLIAAAPDLLEACKRALELGLLDDLSGRMVNDAVKRATL